MDGARDLPPAQGEGRRPWRPRWPAHTATSQPACSGASSPGGRRHPQPRPTKIPPPFPPQDGFGWGFYKALNKQYAELKAQPRDDAERIQAWIVRSSKAAKVNLVPFYRSWGFPIAAETVKATAALPRWTKNPMAPVPEPRG